MKNKVKTLLSGFLVLSMVTLASPISLLANEIPQNVVATAKDFVYPTEVINLTDETSGAGDYVLDIDGFDYASNLYTTDSGSIYVNVLSHNPDKQNMWVYIAEEGSMFVKDWALLSPSSVGMATAEFKGLDKSKVYKISFRNYTTSTNITGTYVISAKPIM